VRSADHFARIAGPSNRQKEETHGNSELPLMAGVGRKRTVSLGAGVSLKPTCAKWEKGESGAT
jgi:hypothetical protein